MKKSLKAKKVVVTRAEKQAKSLTDGIERAGGEAISFPLIEFAPVEDLSKLKQAFSHLEKYQWLVFTSANAVDFFFDAAEAEGVKFYFYPDLKIATVGEKTKLQLEQRGYRTNFVPIQFTAEVLAENMDEDIRGKHILIPRSEKASDEYLEVFLKRGAIPHAIAIYKNKNVPYSKEEVETVFDQQPDYLTFTSGSTVEAFDHFIQEFSLVTSAKWICIGPSTAKLARKLGYDVAATAEPHTIEGMIEAIKKLEDHV
ncbi:MAG: uroporphyrinogen-III synthase [Vicingaceae bacterium]